MIGKRFIAVSALCLATTGVLGAGVASAQTGGGSQPGYCSPATGCAGNDSNGNRIVPQSQAPDETTLRGRISCGGGLAMAALGPGGVAAGVGAGLTFIGC